MKKWRCVVCGYIFEGDKPPEVCPVCGAGPEFFEEIGQAAGVSEDTRRTQNLQQVLFKVPCGLFMVSAIRAGHPNGMINNTAFQITDSPLQLLLGMDKRHLTTEYIEASGAFVVNFLTPDQLSLVKQFGFKSGRETAKFDGQAWRPGVTGAPILEAAAGYLECRVQPGKTLDAGTHRVFLAELVAGEMDGLTPVLCYQEYRKRKQELW